MNPIKGSILDDTKKIIGFEPAYEAFDVDILMSINQAFDTLAQIGVNKGAVFQIENRNQTWSDFPDQTVIATIKAYLYVTVRLAFDPPATSFGITALKEMKSEHEWRLNVATDRRET